MRAARRGGVTGVGYWPRRVVRWELLEVAWRVGAFLRETQDAPAEKVRSAPIGGAMVSYRSSALWLLALREAVANRGRSRVGSPRREARSRFRSWAQ
jgi:hypothetical protein